MDKVYSFVDVTRDGMCSSQRTVELRLSGLIGTARRPDMQIIRTNGFSFENRLNWQFEVRLLLFTVSTCV
jgi:hypothetical protein